MYSMISSRIALRPILLALIVSVLAAHDVSAQTARVISFEEAVRIALEDNIRVKQSENSVELQTRQVFQRRMDFLPSLSFSTNGSRGSGFAQDQAGRNIQFTNKNVNGSFSTQVNVFSGFADVAALEQARYDRDASTLNFDRTRQDVVFSVADNFLAYVNATEQVRIQEENLASQQQQLEQIEEFVNVGARPISELYQQQALTAQAELQVLDAQRTAQVNKSLLIQVLQLDPFGEYEFAAPDLEAAPLALQDVNLDELLRSAFAERPDLEAQETQILAAEQGVRIAKSQYWPSVNIGGSYRSNFSPDADGDVFDQLDINRGNSIGFSISYPIFDRFSRGTQVQQAEVQYRNEILELDEIRQQIALQVRQAYLDYELTTKRVAVTETQVLAAEQAVAAAEERYNVGAGTLVELTQARAQYVEAVSSQTQARYDMLFQAKLIDYYVGRLNPTQPRLR